MTAVRPESPASTRERIIVAAAALTVESGWSSVTMSALAERVGVSRQTVYNEVGAKPALGEALILHELARFLAGVDDAFARHPRDVGDAVEAAALAVLALAQDDPLIAAIVASSYGADSELLPFLTTRSGSVLQAAQAAVRQRLATYDLALDADRLAVAVDVVVRLVLSHVVRPGGPPGKVARDTRWVMERLLTRPLA